MNHFEVKIPGKWVLAGEHAVLRGSSALALPHPNFALNLKYENNGQPLQIAPIEAGPITRDLIQGLGADATGILGRLEIQSTIPVGSGLGSSAALCVSLIRFFLHYTKQERSEDWIRAKATEMENKFHGKSSGMDIAAVCSQEPIRFVRNRAPEKLGITQLPRFTFHDTGFRVRTVDCINQVEKMINERPEVAHRVDAQMALAADLATEGLLQFNQGQKSRGLSQIAQAMDMAHGCYEEWGLLPADANRIRAELFHQGARAVKLTGAGGGGFLVALWGE